VRRKSALEASHLAAVQLNAAVPQEAAGNFSAALAPPSSNGREPCDSGEELFAGLCYKTCSSLTEGGAPIRTSSWTCCQSHPCSVLNTRGSVGSKLVCNGFDVSAQGGCPHKPGKCLDDEELHLGVCYKKCTLLTEGTFPHRVAAATCCKTEGLGCLDIRNDKTSNAFDVGGGAGEENTPTLATAHLPREDGVAEPQAAKGLTTEERARQTSYLSAPSGGNLIPLENRHDGNVCGFDEELYAGLCYKKCSLLTKGQAPIRTSSWTCCEGHPCGLTNEHGAVGKTLLCNGFDVASDGSCPHKPGACLVDEELHLGMCYKKCRLLTHGRFPYRFAAATCCREQGLGCLNVLNDLTSMSFNVGGGAGDGDASTPSVVHFPQQRLTEASDDDEVITRRLRSSSS